MITTQQHWWYVTTSIHFRQSGASGLALALLKEIETEHKSDWLEWEQELWLALRAADDYTMLLSRLESALTRLDGELRARVYAEIAGVHIVQDNPRSARSVLRAMWVDSKPDSQTAMTARRLMIDAYRAENLFLDADAACSRFQSEYYPDDASWGELRPERNCWKNLCSESVISSQQLNPRRCQQRGFYLHIGHQQPFQRFNHG